MTLPRTILITGATDGLGLALAERLAADGADLVLQGRSQAKLDRIADQFAARGVSRPGPRPRTSPTSTRSAAWPLRFAHRWTDSTSW
ncbi:SDR family NAD(P)-dependent oxidoreductase [Streptomyces alanosinicus]|uniref:SDR family NAD(P)-dependent oxidoreductase n=1 Tax=Streptomyces alanosinicus TaxID=68171 RepID=A0A919D731_9ACTN|nr:SDR family NAD(P)-dependent oxidoreductase [Streptomyces alanosinicus]GHE13440.1 hypothetical protein GCM10010339_80370 [Streptomyces alanosinicus]